MALNYRYDKKGKVTGIGWGKGPNAKAGTAKTKSDNEAARSTTKSTTKKKKPLSRAAKMKAERAYHKDMKKEYPAFIKQLIKNEKRPEEFNNEH